MVSILELVTLIFMHCDDSRVTLSYIGYYEGLGFFTISVSYYKVLSIVNESVATRSMSLSQNETDEVRSAILIDFDDFIHTFEDLSVNNNGKLPVVL